MYLQANPTRAKTEQEKAEMREKYTPGDEVMRIIELKRESSEDAADRRMLEEVRDMSLREAGVRGQGSYQRGHRHRQRDGSRDVRAEDSRQGRRGQNSGRDQEQLSTTNRGRTRSDHSPDARAQARHLGHQASLRSLLSDSDVDSAEMQTEILRQIQEEGLLDGVDLDNLDVSQEDELSERIAEAYRRRHRRELRPQPSDDGETSTQPPRSDRERPRHHHRVPRPDPVTNSSHPPISRPHLLEAYPTDRGHRHRTSSEHRRQTSPATAAALAASGIQRQAARSATDLSDRPRTRTNVRDRPSENTRRTTDPDQQRPSGGHRRRASHSRQDVPAAAPDAQSQVTSPVAINRTIPDAIVQQSFSRGLHAIHPSSANPQRETDNSLTPYPLNDLISTTTDPADNPYPAQPASFVERSITCDRCGTASIQHDLHFGCSVCSSGNYNICLRCYRTDKGCLHWFGFGKAARKRFERQARSSNESPPHRLTGRRYLPPPDLNPQILSSQTSPPTTTSDPASRLQSGFFCSACSTFSNDCFWKCDRCNDGEWGYCNPCVNQAKSCTHPLLPIAHTSLKLKAKGVHRTSGGHAFTALSPTMHQPNISGPTIQDGFEDYTPLTFSTHCDICSYPIPPSTTRYHCPHCSSGDYDICISCYTSLPNSNRFTPENGPSGWRKCPQGHRMLILGFEDGPTGQRRVVVKDRVGGYGIRDEDTVGKSPPVGTGLRATALWAYWPKEGVDDELGFPKGAEIVECRDRNGDWWEGWYCGKGGLWPGGYARVQR